MKTFNENLKDFEKFLHAFNCGEKVEISTKCIGASGSEYWSEWSQIKDPMDFPVAWNGLDILYRLRISKEDSEPRVRPYQSVEEFLNAQEKHGPWIYAGDEAELPVCATNGRVLLHVMEPRESTQHSFVTYTQLLEMKGYRWKDGTVCGILLSE